MIKVLLIFMAWALLFGSCHAKEAKVAPRTQQERAWTLQDTIGHALNHSPAIKRDYEAVNMASESVRQARAGHYPKVDVQASGGVSSLPVSRNE